MKHLVDVCRIGYGHATIEIEGAKDSAEAIEMAMDEAGSHTYNEKEADYEVQGVTPDDRPAEPPPEPPKPAVVAVGNPFDGMRLYGPFSDANDANDWASETWKHEEWHVMELLPETDVIP
jgi:hypothetical protein